MVTQVSTSPAYLDNYQVDINLIPILIQMSRRGILLRQDALRSWEKELGEQKLYYEDICAVEGFDPGKNQQVGYVLASRHNMLPFTKTRKQLKVDEEVLSRLSDPLAAVVLQHRSVTKLLGTYIRPWIGKPRAYTNFRMDLATSRLASSDRNIQNIPPKIREIFAPDTGIWTWMDWSQIEMRLFAYLTQDPVMLAAYREGEDIHTITQMLLWPQSDPDDELYRLLAKKFNFSMIYFAGPRTLSRDSGLPEKDCARYRETWLDNYSEAHRWMRHQADEGPARGYATTIWDRKLRLPDPIETSIYHVQYCAVNYPVQGSAAGYVARAMLQCDHLGYDMAVQVHDELVMDGDVDPPESLAHLLPEVHLPFKVQKSPVWV